MLSGNLNEIKSNLKKFIDAVLNGQVVTILKRNVPIAQIVPIETKPAVNQTRLGIARGSVTILSDLTEPFLPEDDWEMHR